MADAGLPETPAPLPQGEAGRFTTGPIMRHVSVMTLTGSLGLTFMFLVDFVTLLYVSMLGDERLTSAVGYAWTLQFFTVAMGMGFSIAAGALVSRALGARDRAGARRIAGSTMTLACGFLVIGALALTALRGPIVAALGAEGEVLEEAVDFLAITLPTMPFMTFGMLGSSLLRAAGDARRAMMVTLSAGIVVALAAPFLIFETVLGLPGMDLGITGAALALALTRVMTATMGYRFCVGVHDLVARPRWRTVRADARRVLDIAAPSGLAQMSTPVANAILTAAISEYGPSAVAGWAVVSRMTVLAFAGVLSLAGAIGGIFGQNYGAGLMHRVVRTYRDAVAFCIVYVGAIWAILYAASGAISAGFSLSAEGGAVVHAFATLGAAGFLFAGCAFVATAAFNTLGRPLGAMAVNWGRDGLAVPAMLWLVAGAIEGPEGVVYAQAAGMAAAGVVAGWAGWLFVNGLARRLGDQQGAAAWPSR
ncbi:MATE family efflux transporter [uncultured Albimonas sp.]|uniref:MATE family efflux transporter n=1 Tax=uncultured Albimonas sp. TaxID=1331701 RepID=UPI0030ED4AE9|tara:strand:- start:825 stop:2258 length:1434 start_codon:yes stop_codon:yes gene_type:complete